MIIRNFDKRASTATPPFSANDSSEQTAQTPTEQFIPLEEKIFSNSQVDNGREEGLFLTGEEEKKVFESLHKSKTKEQF